MNDEICRAMDNLDFGRVEALLSARQAEIEAGLALTEKFRVQNALLTSKTALAESIAAQSSNRAALEEIIAEWRIRYDVPKEANTG